MDRRFLVVLGLSLVFALVVSSVFYFQFANRSGSTKKVDSNVKDVVVATQALAVGQTVKAADVRLNKVPVAQFPKGAFSKIEEVLDRPVVSNILPDEPVLEGRLALRGSGLGLAPIIPVGMRAVSVRVTDVAGVAGFVLPGLRVDVLVTGQPPGGQGAMTSTCLQNILVLSAGQTIQPDARGQAINTPTVTLLVNPEQAETLTLAGNEGRIQLVLRNSSDQEISKTAGMVVNRLYGGNAPEPSKPVPVARPRSKPPVTVLAAAPPPAVAPAPPPEIVVIRGVQRSVEIVPSKAN
ncbi:MAG TPA: Flp pilus assembly protein CpaB [Bryobacteraceae bacterium]|nr:Flp pilus assembly protein CpaB [Bryobacteraceae bacterium]